MSTPRDRVQKIWPNAKCKTEVIDYQGRAVAVNARTYVVRGPDGTKFRGLSSSIAWRKAQTHLVAKGQIKLPRGAKR